MKDDIGAGFRRLTARERQILSRIAGGKTSKAIAAELKISLHTVKTYREKLAQKLGDFFDCGAHPLCDRAQYRWG